MSNPQITDTPNGFVCVQPWAYVDKTLIVDLNVYLASVRQTRNILSTRNAVKSQSNIHEESSFILPKVADGVAPTEYEHTFKSGNLTVIFESNRPVRLIAKNTNGTIDLGLTTLFVLTSSLISLKMVNEKNEGNAEVNLIAI